MTGVERAVPVQVQWKEEAGGLERLRSRLPAHIAGKVEFTDL
jgi:hypothetical protein